MILEDQTSLEKLETLDYDYLIFNFLISLQHTKNCISCNIQGVNWKDCTLCRGHYLTFMRGMNSESVDLIATDPPFNKGRGLHAAPELLSAGAKLHDRWSWEQDVDQDWGDQFWMITPN